MNEISLDTPRPGPHAVDILRQELDDPTLDLAYRQSTAGVWIDLEGVRVTQDVVESGRSVTPLERDGDWIAAVLHDPGLDAAPERIQLACNLVVALIDDERLIAELRAQLRDERASRARILAASDRQRRRFERNLHDGAQQRLVGLALTLQLAGRRAGDDQAVTELLDESVAELEQAIGDPHELARGLHPAIVNDAGLAEALAALAERPGIPVTLDVDLPDRLPDAAAIGGYYLAAEALTNANKHSHATTITVTARVADGALQLSITDDGRGGVSSSGTGLVGLDDRLAALGGRLVVSSQRDRGTAVTGYIPLQGPVGHVADDILLRVIAADGTARPYADGSAHHVASVRDDRDRRRRALKWIIWQTHAGPGEIVDAQPETEDIRYAKSLLLIVGGNRNIPSAVRDWVIGYLTANGYSEEVLDDARAYDDADTIVELMGSPRMSIAARPLVYDGLRARAMAGYGFTPEDFDPVLRGAEALGVPRDVVADLHQIVVEEARLRERRHELVVAPAMPKLLNDSIAATMDPTGDG